MNQLIERRNLIKHGKVKKNISTRQISANDMIDGDEVKTLSNDKIVFVDQADDAERQNVKK